MILDLSSILILGTAFLVLFALAELCYHKLHWQGEHSRKLVHMGTGLLTLLFPILLNSFWSVFLLCALFLIILLSSLKFNLLKSINDIDRKSYGSILYPIIVCIIFYFYQQLSNKQASCSDEKYNYFYLPILIMALCDPIAALVGKRWPMGKIKLGNETKTLAGAAGFISIAFILCFIFVPMSLNLQSGLAFWFTCFAIAFGTCITELFSKKGFDNFLIPFVAIAILYVCEYKLF
jgi:phytol kinase